MVRAVEREELAVATGGALGVAGHERDRREVVVPRGEVGTERDDALVGRPRAAPVLLPVADGPEAGVPLEVARRERDDPLELGAGVAQRGVAEVERAERERARPRARVAADEALERGLGALEVRGRLLGLGERPRSPERERVGGDGLAGVAHRESRLARRQRQPRERDVDVGRIAVEGLGPLGGGLGARDPGRVARRLVLGQERLAQPRVRRDVGRVLADGLLEQVDGAVQVLGVPVPLEVADAGQEEPLGLGVVGRVRDAGGRAEPEHVGDRGERAAAELALVGGRDRDRARGQRPGPLAGRREVEDERDLPAFADEPAGQREVDAQDLAGRPRARHAERQDVRDRGDPEVAAGRGHLGDAAGERLGEPLGERLVVGRVRARRRGEDGEVDVVGEAGRGVGLAGPERGANGADGHDGGEAGPRGALAEPAAERGEPEGAPVRRRPARTGATGGLDGREHAAERVGQRRGVGVAGAGVLGQAPGDDGVERRRDVGDRARRRRVLVEHGVEDGRVVGRRERAPARQHLVEHDPERPHVGPRVGVTARLLGRPVLGGARRVTGPGQRDAGDPGDPEVEDLGRPVGAQEHVGRLEVAVDDPPRVRGRHPRRDPSCDADGRLGAQRPTLEPGRQRLAVVARQRDVGPPVRGLAHLVDRAHVRVVDGPRGPGLLEQPPRGDLVARPRGRQQLQRDRPAEPLVLGAVHDPHPTAPQLAEEPVPTDPLRKVGGGRDVGSQTVHV